MLPNVSGAGADCQRSSVTTTVSPLSVVMCSSPSSRYSSVKMLCGLPGSFVS